MYKDEYRPKRIANKNTQLVALVVIVVVVSAGTIFTLGSVNEGTNGDTPSTSITVYVTKTGEKYHRAGCQYLSQSSIAKELRDAISLGYEPCSVCNPPTSYP